MFGAPDLAALEAAVVGAQSPGARRLRQLAQSLAIGAAPRMEQLRFFAGRSPILLGLLCARVAGPNGSSFLVAATSRSAPVEAPRSGFEVEEDSIADDPVAPSFTPPPLDGPVRFLWNLNSEGRFGPADPALAARLGPNAPLAGELAEALCARLGIDPAGAFIQALVARRTFSALRLDWPEPGLARARVALMSGAPQFDRERKFAGFRGFGVFTGESAPIDARASRSSAPAMQSEEPPPPPIESTEMEALGSSRPPIPAVVETAVAPSTSRSEPSPVVTPPAEETGIAPATPSKVGREGGAEIFVLRPTASIPTGGLNVVPLRPAAASAPTPPPSAPEAWRGGEEDTVELSSQERDAFREIARALGARMRAPRADEGASELEHPPVEPIASAQDDSRDSARAGRAGRRRLAGQLPSGGRGRQSRRGEFGRYLAHRRARLAWRRGDLSQPNAARSRRLRGYRGISRRRRARADFQEPRSSDARARRRERRDTDDGGGRRVDRRGRSDEADFMGRRSGDARRVAALARSGKSIAPARSRGRSPG